MIAPSQLHAGILACPEELHQNMTTSRSADVNFWTGLGGKERKLKLEVTLAPMLLRRGHQAHVRVELEPRSQIMWDWERGPRSLLLLVKFLVCP
jgi:hypothetical protein